MLNSKTENTTLEQELKPYVSQEEAGKLLGISGARVGKLKLKEGFPASCVRWGKVLFRRNEILAWGKKHGRT